MLFDCMSIKPTYKPWSGDLHSRACLLLQKGPVLLLRHDAVARIQPMGVQLSLKAVLTLAGILATASDRCSKTGPRSFPAWVASEKQFFGPCYATWRRLPSTSWCPTDGKMWLCFNIPLFVWQMQLCDRPYVMLYDLCQPCWTSLGLQQ